MNYYEILRVPTTASVNEIKNSYKKLVKKYHPDIYEGNKFFAESKIKEINEAYETLSVKSKKDMYDAELNYKKYEVPQEDFVKKYTTEDILKYTKIYNKNFRKNNKEKIVSKKEEKKLWFDFNSVGKRYFFKFDELFQTDEKEDMLIIFLLAIIFCLCISIIGLII